MATRKKNSYIKKTVYVTIEINRILVAHMDVFIKRCTFFDILRWATSDGLFWIMVEHNNI